MKKSSLLFIAVAAILLSACKGKEDTPLTPEIYNIGIKTASVSATGGDVSISFTSNTQWEASSDAAWITFDKSKGGPGEFDIKVKVQGNDTGDTRTATITVAAGDKSFTVPVEQAQNDMFGVNVTTINATYEGGDFEIIVSSNIKFEANSSASWVTITDTKAVLDSKLSISVAKNVSSENREASVTISSSEGSVVISVKQEGGATDEIVAAEYIYYGDYYDNGTSNWVLHLIDKGFSDGKTEPKRCYSFDIIADKALNAHDYPSGLPTGEYILDSNLETGTLNRNECYTISDYVYWEKATLSIGTDTISAVILDKKGNAHKIVWNIDPEALTVSDNTYSTSVDKNYDITFKECTAESYGQYYRKEFSAGCYITVLEFAGGLPQLGTASTAEDTYGSISLCSETEDITGTYTLVSSIDDNREAGTIYGPDTIFYSYDEGWESIKDGTFKPGSGTLTVTKDGDSYKIEGSFVEDYPYGDKDLHTLDIHFEGAPEFVDMSKQPEAKTSKNKLSGKSKIML